MDFWKYLVGICSGHKLEAAGHGKSIEANEEERARSMRHSVGQVTRERKVCCLGLELGESKTGSIVVMRVFSDNVEFHQNKVEAGDRLLAVDSNIVKGYDLDVVAALLEGPAETAVNLHLARPLHGRGGESFDFVFVTLIRDNSIIESKFSSSSFNLKAVPTVPPIYADIISYGSLNYQSKTRGSKASHRQDPFLYEDRITQMKFVEAGEAARRKYQVNMAQSQHRRAVSVQDVRNKQLRSRNLSSDDELKSTVYSQHSHQGSSQETALRPEDMPIWFSARKSRAEDRTSVEGSINKQLHFDDSSTASSETSPHGQSINSIGSPF
ncbi:hypothetical protein GUITHDRAFT_151940 [Guillardia theta CCMP2712]|uniref:PDZ domain-containing protein n=2 Tax=Guillardia theta TaxID=55529 RepID=L1JIK1_GUITC|nr:hypothetical protein GUITHDRAFT_151940 [Guillardia theta CCMP2712]EKX48157.1 hypothetical protein GUITHDRAFT_151940 [Guillardia theta CCMP2712]|eukprot:XP_005835137.1 hypothetical protein GUITHDRAFT_151940 [Guillardia theta CCMP2712]